ncbi:hypothetical protein SDC9_103894 [bioreactor metagenome]|uniref:Uncharacterized protein n=1 Tax=bioreactor metagenome TaxID=1076179 RepID=A0A645AW99_9ZZZZ
MFASGNHGLGTGFQVEAINIGFTGNGDESIYSGTVAQPLEGTGSTVGSGIAATIVSYGIIKRFC